MKWEERSVKRIVRQLLLDQLWFDRPISYLGLPAGQAIFEKQLVKHLDVAQAVFFERDPKIMRELQSHCRGSGDLASLPSVCIQEDVDHWLESNKNIALPLAFDFVWLDYCGPITTRRLRHLQTLGKAMSSDSIFAVTFMVGREKSNILSLFRSASRDEAGLKHSLPLAYFKRIQAVVNVMKNTGIHFNILVQPYADKVPMLLIIFKKARKDNGNYLLSTRTVVDVKPYLRKASFVHSSF